MGWDVLRCNQQVFLGGTHSPLAKVFCFFFWGGGAGKLVLWQKKNPCAHGAGGPGASGQDPAASPRAGGLQGARSGGSPPAPPPAGVRCQPGGGTAVPCCHLMGRGLPAAGWAGDTHTHDTPLPETLLPRRVGLELPWGAGHPRAASSLQPVGYAGAKGASPWSCGVGGTSPSAVRGN